MWNEFLITVCRFLYWFLLFRSGCLFQNVDKHLEILQTCRVCVKRLGKWAWNTNAKYLQNDIFVPWGQNFALDSPYVHPQFVCNTCRESAQILDTRVVSCNSNYCRVCGCLMVIWNVKSAPHSPRNRHKGEITNDYQGIPHRQDSSMQHRYCFSREWMWTWRRWSECRLLISVHAWFETVVTKNP